jgi:1-acyl-sn-glycerol-3-phosphate acyltransferase
MRTPNPPKSFWIARTVRATLGNVLKLLFRVSIVGRENLPATGGVVFAGNHVSYGDPVLIWCAMPRPTHFMARADLWRHTFLGWCLDQFWAFPVERASADRVALTKAANYLAAGEPVGIFPNGTRNKKGEAIEAQDGAAFIASRADVPMVPVGIAGTDKIRPKGSRFIHFPKVTIAVGEPISKSDFEGLGRKETVAAMTAEIMRRIDVQVQRAREVSEG